MYMSHTMKNPSRWIYMAAICFIVSKIVAHDELGHFSNQWVIRLEDNFQDIETLAKLHGYRVVGMLPGVYNSYLLERVQHPKKSYWSAHHLTERLLHDERVQWSEQQRVKPRVKRDFFEEMAHDRLAAEYRFNDPLWPMEWYLHDTRMMPDLPRLDHHVMEVWDSGFTGDGVIISVLDDGLEWNHTDIFANYNAETSYDINDNDTDPFPRYDPSDMNKHGTRCAGEISMIADNNFCGVGVAYNSKISAVRMLDGPTTDAVESVALGYGRDKVAIYSSSWGPTDDGMTVDGPGFLAKEVITKAVKEGRRGLGVIYIWAAGNGGSHNDNCNCDGYINLIETISIASATQHGLFPYYGEKCASIMACTFSSGAYSDQKISTIDLHNECTQRHSGTSAAAPIAAGIIALALEANAQLTWRDIQHIVAWTADFFPVYKNRGWRINGAGFLFNSRFGFGFLNARLFVAAALNWTTVPAKIVQTYQLCDSLSATKCEFATRKLQSEGSVIAVFRVDRNDIKFLEHVQITFTINYTRRGDIEAFMTSPQGTHSVVMFPRDLDNATNGFRNWTVTSVHYWGEKPAGSWKFIVRDRKPGFNTGFVQYAQLTLHGLMELPEYFRYGPKRYSQPDLIQWILDPADELQEDRETRIRSPSQSYTDFFQDRRPLLKKAENEV